MTSIILVSTFISAPTEVSSSELSTDYGCTAPVSSWWRTRAAQTFGPQCHIELEATLGQIGLLGEPRWASAQNGDAAAAIGIAIPAIRGESTGSFRLDVVMSSVLLSALRGSEAASLVLAFALRRHQRASQEVPANWLSKCAIGRAYLSIDLESQDKISLSFCRLDKECRCIAAPQKGARK
jgi:hypothetical protein